MAKKVLSLFRVLFIILTLLLTQVQSVLALPEPQVEAEAAAEPLRQDSYNCKTGVTARFVDPATIPQPDPIFVNPDKETVLGATPDEQVETGEVLTAWITIRNSTDGTKLPECTGVSEAITITNINVNIGGSVRTNYNPSVELPVVLQNAGDYLETLIQFTVPGDAPSQYNVLLEITAHDTQNHTFSDHDWDIPKLGRTATVLGPGFKVESFEPNLPEPYFASPGALVDFTLTITNPRSTSIRAIEVPPGSPQHLISACNGIGNWTLVEGGGTFTQLDAGQDAQCVITDVPMPSSGAESYTMVGELLVADATDATAKTFKNTVTSQTVQINMPSVDVSKSVTGIFRNNVPINPPAMAGDRIEYLITVDNAGEIPLNNISIIDSLKGLIYIDPSITLMPNDPPMTVNVEYDVRPDSPDPLVNRVSVTAMGGGNEVNADASASVDLADSALTVTLSVLDENEDPISQAMVGQIVTYRLRIQNTGTTRLTDVRWRNPAAPYPLRLVGFDPATDILQTSLIQGDFISLDRDYMIMADDDNWQTADGDDPLVNTTRIQARTVTNQLIYGQDQVTLDIANPEISISAAVTSPPNPTTILRGTTVSYQVTVLNKGAAPICNVRVDMLKRDPDTGAEVPIFTGVNLNWPGTAGQLGGNESASGPVDYEVTGADRDPLHIIFRVSALEDCAGSTELLSDRTSISLDISDAQINVDLQFSVGVDGVAEVGDEVPFTLTAYNVGPVTLSDLSAEYCLPNRDPSQNYACAEGKQVPITQLAPTELLTLSEDPAVGPFTYRIVEADLDAEPFIVQATLYGTDNEGKRVSIKVAVVVPVATQKLLLSLKGPQEAVLGDHEEFNFTLTNNSGVGLENIRIYNLLIGDDPDVIYGYPFEVVYEAETMAADAAPVTGPFTYQIVPDVGMVGADVLRMRIRVMATTATGHNAVSSATFDVMLIPILTVNKSGPGAVVAGQQVTYLVSIKNESREQTVTITSYLDEVLDGYGISIDNNSFIGWAVPEFEVGVLGPGKVITNAPDALSIASVNAEPTPLANQFYVSGTRSYDGELVYGVDDHSVDIACPIQFTYNVINDDEPDADYTLGESLTWEIGFKNISMLPLTGVTILESLQYGGAVPGLESFDLDAGEEGSVPPGPPIKITNDYYGPGTNDDEMVDTVTATFTETAGTQDCTMTFRRKLYSPIGISKIGIPSVAFTGETVTYTIGLINVTESDDEHSHFYVTVDDTLLGGTLPMQYNLPESEEETTAGDMGPGEEIYKQSQHTVLESDPDELTNVATATFPDPYEPSVTFKTWADWKIYTGDPLLITKTPSPNKNVVPGTPVAYTYVLTNKSPYYIKGLTLTDDKIGGLIPGRVLDQYINLEPFQTYAPEELEAVEWVVPMDAPDPLVNIATAEYTLVIPDEGSRPLKTIVEATVDLEDPDVTIEKSVVYYTGAKPTRAEIIPADLKSGVVKVEADQAIHYCFTVKNNNSSPEQAVHDILIVDSWLASNEAQEAFEAELALTDPPTGYTRDGAQLFGGEDVFFCVAEIMPSVLSDDPFVNTVTLDGTRSGTETLIHDEDKLTIDIKGGVIRISKEVSQISAAVGETIKYTLTISNVAKTAVTVTGIDVTDTRLGGGAVNMDDCFDWEVEGEHSLDAGETLSCPYDYTIQATDPDPLINDAHVTGFIPDDQNPTPVEDTTRASVAVTESPLRVTKSVTPSIANVADEVMYTITVTNLGQQTVFGVWAEDTRYNDYYLPGEPETLDLKIEQIVQQQGYDRDLSRIVETLPITYNLIMPDAAALSADHTLDPFVNTVEVFGRVPSLTGGEDTIVSTTADATVDLVNPNIRITMQPLFLAAAPGQDMDYTVTITNTGGATETVQHLVVSEDTDAQTWTLDNCGAAIDPVTCPFAYGPEPFKDHDGDGDMESNPMEGKPYDPAHMLLQHEQLIGTIRVQVPDDIATNEFTNTAEVNGETTATEPVDVWDRTSANIDIRNDGINVAKSASLASAPVGTQVHYKITVTNVGSPGASVDQRSAIDHLVFSDVGISPDGTDTYSGPFMDSPEAVIPGDDSATLDPDEFYVYEYDYTLKSTDADPYVNRATVVATTTRGGQVVNNAQAVVDIEMAQVAVDKYACTQNMALPPDLNACTTVVNIGDTLTPDTVYYYLHIYNPSVVAIQNIDITDTLVPDTTFDTITWPGQPGVLESNDELPLGPDEVWFMYPYDVLLNSSDPLVNQVSVTATTAAGYDLEATDTAYLNLVTSDLQLIKTAVPAQAQIGGEIQYRLTVVNLNADPAANPITNVQIYDPLAGVDGVCAALLNLNTSDPQECTFNYTVTTADPSPLVNRAEATGFQASEAVSDSATFTLEIVTPGLSVTKTAVPPVAGIGDVVTYTYVIENTSPDAILNDLVVVDSDPTIGSTFYEGTQISPWPDYLSVGQVVTRTATHTVTAQDTDPLTNTVTVTGMFGTEPVMAQVTETVSIADGALVVSNSPSVTYARAGQAVTFSYVVQNVGAEEITGIELTDNLCNPDPATPEVLGDILPGASASFDCTVTAQLPGPIVSTVFAEGQVGGVPVFDTATAEVLVIPADSALLVEKTAAPLVVAPDGLISYTVRVTNVGTEAVQETLTGFQVDDPTVVLMPPPPDTLGLNESFIMTGTINAPDLDSITNTVAVSATGVTSGATYEASDSATVAIVSNPDLAGLIITKTPDRSRVALGGTITYNFHIQNVGATTYNANEVSLVDLQLLPSDVLVPYPLAQGGAFTYTSQPVTVPTTHATPTFDNTASVNYGGSVQDSATASVVVELLQLTKAVTIPGRIPPGSDIPYTITITNLSETDLSDVVLEDDNPLMEYDPPLPDPLTIPGGIGNQVIITGSITVPPNWNDPILTNTARVLVGDVEMAEASVDAGIQLVTLAKVPVPPDAPAGGRVDYTFTVQNQSTAPLIGLSLNDPGITEDTPLPGSISGGATISGTGHLFIPSPWPNATFDNTAQVLMNGVVVSNDATASVNVLSSPIGVQIFEIMQDNGDNDIYAPAQELQTGKPTFVSFSIQNLGSVPISTLSYRVLVNSSGTALNMNCQLVTPATLEGVTLAAGSDLPVTCQYTPPAGAAQNVDLTPELQVEVSGTVEGQPSTATASTAVTYVDLLLEVALTIVPDTAESGDSVTYSVTLTNQGASPIGCGAAVASALPCHLTPDFGGDAVLQGLFASDFAGILNTVLNPVGQIGNTTTLTADPRTIGDNDQTITHTLIVRGGYWSAPIQTANLLGYYVVQDQDDATLTVTDVEPESDLVVDILEVYQEDNASGGGHLTLLQTGKPTFIRFELDNAGTVDITGLSYIVRKDGVPLNPACALVAGTTLPNRLRPTDNPVTLTCRFIPPVGAENNTNLSPDLRVVARGTAGTADITGGNTTTIDLVDLQIDIQLILDPAEAMPGDIVEYRVRLLNQGASPIGCDDAVVDEAGLPCHLELMTGGNTVLNTTLGDVIDEVHNLVLDAGDSQIFTASRTIAEGEESVTYTIGVDGGFWSDVLLADQLGYYVAHDEDTADLTISGGQLELTITANPNPPIYGSNITYSVAVRNTGTGAVNNLTATWQISPVVANADGIMLVSSEARPFAQTTSGQLTLNVNSLEPDAAATAILAKTEDQTRRYIFMVTVVGDGISGEVTASTTLTLTPIGVGTPTPTGTITATLDPNAVDPQVAKKPGSESAQQGGSVVWTITIRNGGTAAMSNVTMKDAIPDTLVLNSATSDRGEAVTAGQLLTVGTGALNPGDIVTVTVNTTVARGVAAPAIITNTACAARDGGPQVCVNASVNIGPGVGGLPATGIGGFDGWPLNSLLAVFLAGALMILMSAEISRRRLLFVGLFVLIALVVLAGAIVMLVTRGDEEETETPVAQVPTATVVSTIPDETEESVLPAETEEMVPPGETPIAPDTGEPFVASPVTTPYVVPEPTGPRTLIIPKLADQFAAPIPIIDLPIVDRRWDVSGLGFYVGWLEGTTWMDPAWGNTVLAAHVQLGFRNPGPFWGLGELVPGDEIIVMEGDVERKFVVSSSRKVDPDDWTVTAPTNGPTLTLLTCTEWDRSYGVFSQRMVIQAVPVEQAG